MEPRIITVGIGELKFCDCPDTVLATYSLGSCIGLTAYDPVTRVGAMAHIMLPKGNCTEGEEGKCASTCVRAVIDGMISRGSPKARIVVKMAGGAKILAVAGTPNGTGIGQQNQQAVAQELERLGLRAAASDCGGSFGRTMRLFLDTGVVEVITATRGRWTI
ncbi:MAG: chemotaxis protein CheD [Ignavibacteriales bacterium]